MNNNSFLLLDEKITGTGYLKINIFYGYVSAILSFLCLSVFLNLSLRPAIFTGILVGEGFWFCRSLDADFI